MECYELQVDGMTCTGCERMIQDEVTTLPGIATVDADSESDVVMVEGDPDRADEVRRAIEGVGYVPEA